MAAVKRSAPQASSSFPAPSAKRTRRSGNWGSEFRPITIANADAASSGDDGEQIFSDGADTYRMNVTYTSLLVSGLTPGVKYVCQLRAINENTDSLPVVRRKYTSEKIFYSLTYQVKSFQPSLWHS